MNTSYKIVLLGAFVLFAAVVGYYILLDGPQTADQAILNDEYAQQDNPPKPGFQPQPPRSTLADSPSIIEPDPLPVLPTPPAEPETPLQPAVNEETIGLTTDDLPEAPVIAPTQPTDGPLAAAEPSRDPLRPAPDPIRPLEDTPTPQPSTDPRPGPAIDPDTQDPATEPEQPAAEPSPRPVPPTPPTPGSIPRNYTVQAGDTFASIAVKFYKDESAWYQIAQANPSVDPKRLQVGQNIVLPSRDTTVREREEVQPPAPGRDQSYTVRPGDNLSRIARKFYGDSEKWDLIYARNRQLIGPRPDALKVGMELVIPQAYDGAQ